MTNEELYDALDIYVQNFGLTHLTETLFANHVLAYAAGYGFDMSFIDGYEVVMKIIRDYDLKWRV